MAPIDVGRIGGGPIDITPGAATIANGGGWLSRRQLRLAVLAAAVAVMIAGGVAYAALNQPGTTTAGPSHNPPVTLWPSGESLLPGGGLLPPGAVPVIPDPSSPKASAVTPSSTAPAGAVPVTTRPAADRTAPPTATRPTTAAGVPTITNTPPGSGPDPGGPPPEVDSSSLTATFTQDGRTGPNGISHFSGTVEVDNPGRRPASGWEVTMRIRGANPVHGDGSIDVSQDGAKVTFTPYGDSVPAGGSVTFSFTVGGVMAAAPSGCAINGQACN